MELRIDKVYDKNGNEISNDYKLDDFIELSDFLTKILQSKKAEVA